MKKTFYYLLFFLLTSPFCLAQKGGETENVLRKLDRVIADKQIFHAKKEQLIDSIKRRLALAPSDSLKYALCDAIFSQYLHYQTDSALVYARRKVSYLPPGHSPLSDAELAINKAEVFGVMGMYTAANRSLQEIRSQELERGMLNYYYCTVRAYYGWLADYTSYDADRKFYTLQTNAYRDSILVTAEKGIDADIVLAEKRMVDGHPDEALRILNTLLKSYPDMRQKAYIYYTMSEVHTMLGDTREQTNCLALTAISDLEYATREYASLQKLAYLMYLQGDLDRAYKYLNCSMEDAVACNARLRFIEVAQFFPIIDKAYKLKEWKEKRTIRILLLSVSMLSLFLIVAVFYLYRWMKKLSATRRDLSQVNERMKVVNSELAQTGKIKEAYIAHYLDRCVSYLDKLESYRRLLAKLAMSAQVEELYKAIKSEQFIHDERKAFYQEFDKSFLELFPDFIQSFNDLLEPEGRIYPKSNELLTTELRIFALIRLGVTDSNSIAHFLSYSLATIYNYRSKLRNKAIVKDTFEEKVMNL